MTPPCGTGGFAAPEKILEVVRPIFAVNWLVGLFRFTVERFQSRLAWVGKALVELVPAAAPVPEIVRDTYELTTGWYERLYFPAVHGALAWLSDAVPAWLIETLLLAIFTWGAASRAAIFHRQLGDRRYFHAFRMRLENAWASRER